MFAEIRNSLNLYSYDSGYSKLLLREQIGIINNLLYSISPME